jgi:hypothetical protein
MRTPTKYSETIAHARAMELLTELEVESRVTTCALDVYEGKHPTVGQLLLVVAVSGDAILRKFPGSS